MWILPILLFFRAFAGEIEIFCDWASDAKGEEMFPLIENVADEKLPMASLLKKELKERGFDLYSWEMNKYFPYLMSWDLVQNFADLKCLLGWSNKKPLKIDSAFWVFWNLGPKLTLGNFSKVPKEKLILVMWEPPTTQPGLYNPKLHEHFSKIFTWDDDLVDNKKYFKFTYPTLVPQVDKVPSFDEKKFCVMICRRLTSRHPKELYSSRKEMIKFFENKEDHELDLYGYQWKKGKYKSYRGPLHSNKIDKLKEYKFSICYENMGQVKGYITEKMFDCFAAKTVPLYLGASNITDYVPKTCFIDRRDFQSNEELYQFLKNMGEKEYQAYLDAVEKFYETEQAKVFSNKYFVDHFVKELLSKPVDTVR